MKRLLLICTLLSAVTVANAEPPHTMGPPNAEELQKALQLDDAQTAKVKKVLDDAQQQRSKLREKYKPQFEAYRNDMKKLHEQTHTQLKTVMTPKQLQALDAMHDMHRGRVERMHRHMDDDDDEDKSGAQAMPKAIQ